MGARPASGYSPPIILLQEFDPTPANYLCLSTATELRAGGGATRKLAINFSRCFNFLKAPCRCFAFRKPTNID